MHVLVTGVAGFIGSTLAHRLLERGDTVTGIDNLNDYYAVSLKRDRLARLTARERFTFLELDIVDRAKVADLFAQNKFDAVMNLAAQAGVRYSIENPAAYIDANLVGFGNILEGCRHSKVGHLVYASSSSVYGANTKMPFSVHDNVDHPVSLYAATKKSNELMAHAYSHLYRLPATGLRFFTVYGPWGRPDMAIFGFTKAISEGRPIRLFNGGNMRRDFTYVDDVAKAVVKLLDHPPRGIAKAADAAPDPGESAAPWRVFNIGNNQPEELNKIVTLLEKELGRTATKELLPMQPGDVYATFADVDDLAREIDFRPSTSIEDGIARFVSWYRAYHI